MTEYRVFLGNPGAGKSTLINCLLGCKAFKSGLSFGAGLTVDFQEIPGPGGIVYIDTPGLEDVTMRDHAAGEIMKALRKDGKYKLFFFTNLRNGRVSPEDIVMFNQVIGAIDVPDVKFSVIVNNIKPRQYEMITKSKENYDRIVAGINHMKVQTTSIALVPTLEFLDEKDNALVTLPSHFLDFMTNAPSVHLSRERVRSIDIKDDRYTRELNEMKKILQQLRDDNAALHKKIRELERKPGFREAVATAFEALAREVGTWV